MTCSMWAPFCCRTAWRRNTKFCTTRVSTCDLCTTFLDPLLQFRQSSGSTAEHFVLQITPDGSAASDHRIPPQTMSAFLGTQLSETGRHGSFTDACVDRFEVYAMLSKVIPHFLWLNVAQTSVLEVRPHSHEWSQHNRPCEHVAYYPVFSCLSHSQLRETTPPPSSAYSLLVLPCICTGFRTGAGLWQSNLFAETIPQFEFSAVWLVAEPFWMTSQRQVLPSVEKILMYDDYGATTYILLCTFSIVYRSNRIDSNWLKHPVFCISFTQFKTLSLAQIAHCWVVRTL